MAKTPSIAEKAHELTVPSKRCSQYELPHEEQQRAELAGHLLNQYILCRKRRNNISAIAHHRGLAFNSLSLTPSALCPPICFAHRRGLVQVRGVGCGLDGVRLRLSPVTY